ncbi:MAG: ABC transporter ATP-binding protein, partial [Erysipelotrichia bacterium]|nr:ABC transporter ATP-binding protein [Erysipelotrichia bacterium]
SSLVTRMTTDVGHAQRSFGMVLRIFIRAPLILLFSATMAFITGGRLAWLFVVIIPIIGFFFWFIARAAMKYFKRVFKRYDALNESIQENVSGMRVVKSFVREDYEKEKFAKASHAVADDFIKAEKIVVLINPMMNTAIHAVYLLCLYFASIIIFKTVKVLGPNQWAWGELSIPQMSAVLTYGIQILMSIMMITMVITMLVMSIESIRRISEVLDEEPTIVNPEDPLFSVKDGAVVFNNVSFKYKKEAERFAVKNINLKIKPGEFVGIIGSTGAGKTTLVNLISRLYDVSEGSLLVGGHSVDAYDLKTIRDAVAVVLQKNYLFSGTIRSNMLWGDQNATDEQIIRALEIAQVTEVIAGKEGLDRVVEQGGANYSGGQKQRLCIARAILKKPRILILDDSTSAVDTKTDKSIRKALKEDLSGMTKIVIAQRISSIESADQIIVLDNGEINAVGTHKELLDSNEIYQEVYVSQTQKGGH